ncbi:MAG: gliding motility-associated C-terminal domain-containing protein, partial [Cytophagaceae bacterium]
MRTYIFLFFLLFNLAATFGNPGDGASLKFTENAGQWDNHILYKAEVNGGNLFVQKNRFTWAFIEAPAHNHDHTHPQEKTKKKHPEHAKIKAHAFHINFLNSDTNARIVSTGPYPEIFNYFIGDDPSKWASEVKAYSALQYKNLYGSIDMDIFEAGGTLKYEFSIAPGGNPMEIQMSYEGADSVFIKNGEFHVVTSIHSYKEKKPYAYQEINGKRVEVPCLFKLLSNVLTFELPEGYNPNFHLVIDPELVFSTYSGSRADNWGFTATYDEAGNAYSGGIVFGTGFPTTIGAYQTNYQGNVDIGILKFTPNGRNLIYATYLGGTNTEVPISLIVNSNNELLVLAITGSHNYPIRGGVQQFFAGGNFREISRDLSFSRGTDLAISKLSANGSNLLASTFLGGSSNDGLLDYTNSFTTLAKNYGDYFRGEILTDDENNVYIASHSYSGNFPVLNAIQANYRGNGDAVIVKLNSNLSQILWSTYIGGSQEDAAYGIQFDSQKNLFVAGGTRSSNFPITNGSYRTNHSGDIDGFTIKIKNDGSQLMAGTFFGTSSYDQCYFVQIDNVDNVYVLGQSTGSYPISNAAYSNSGSRQFVHKIDNNLSQSLMSTQIGSGRNKTDFSPTAFLVNDCRQILIAGWGGSTNSAYGFLGGNTLNLPVTRDAFQSSTDGEDFYLMVLEPDAEGLSYATYFGGNGSRDHVDGGTSRFDKKGIIYHAVCTGCGGSSLFPSTPGAYSINNGAQVGSGCNNAIFKFQVTAVESSFEVEPEKGCVPLTVKFRSTGTGGNLFTWHSGDGREVTSQRTTFTHQYKEPGLFTAMLIVHNSSNACLQSDTAFMQIEAYKPILPDHLEYMICYPDSIKINEDYNPDYVYQWDRSGSLVNSSVPDPIAFPDTTTTYSVTARDDNGCEAKSDVKVRVAKIVPEIIFENITDCIGAPKVAFLNESYGPLNYTWNLGDGTIITDKEFEHIYNEFGSYHVSLKIMNSKCSYSDSMDIYLEEVLIPNLITPNGDGLNDAYEIKGITSDWRFDIYNRWGKPVYSKEHYDNSWDGEALNEGVYYYLITTPRGVQCKGWVHLL